MAANMLEAYYDKSSDSRKLFQELEIYKSSSIEEQLNQHNVIF